MAHGDESANGDEEIREPDNSTVENWMGQDIERDTRVAEEAVAESSSTEEAEAAFEEKAGGEQAHDKAYPSPGEGPVSGPA